jgi:lysophospholipase L1-like esterase
MAGIIAPKRGIGITDAGSMTPVLRDARAVVHTYGMHSHRSAWATSWAASAQGPYPIGSAVAQPDLRFAFPCAQRGAADQTFRLIVHPGRWGRQARLRFSNAFGTGPVTFDGVFLGLQMASAAIVPGTNTAVTFAGAPAATLVPGEVRLSDAIDLAFVDDPDAPQLYGRKLAVSFHVAGESGAMTWHAKAMTTSYVSPPAAGAQGHREDEAAFLFSTTSWYFLDAVEMTASPDAWIVVAFGDSITDGTGSTLNGDDRWPDVLARRLRARFGNRVAVVNAGIGGNQVVGPKGYCAAAAYRGGPPAVERLERDVLSLSGVATVIWTEGINDFSENGRASVEDVQSGMRQAVARMRARWPHVRVIGGTVVSALGAAADAHGSALEDEKRKALNEFIRNAGLFDAVIDFDRATLDGGSGGMQAMFVPNSTIGGPGDKLHPNRAGYAAMAMAIDLDALLPAAPGVAIRNTLTEDR